ncbi:OmpA family protein [Ferrovibrio terrae]|uniref:OmpA/MotB family protein n=1 Tax=Ferrovibrio terrae TaxID=2594003 RepID=UPI003137FA5B
MKSALEPKAAPKAALAARRMALLAETHAAGSAAEESEDWVVSYMDMVTLLMIVFLTLVGMLWIDKKTRPTVVNVLQIETGTLPRHDFADAAMTPEAPAAKPAVPADQPLPANVTVSPMTRATVDRWVEALRRNGLEDQVQLQIQENRVSIAIRDRLLFASAQSEIGPDGQRMLHRLTALLRDLPGVISVEGHTDDRPIRSDRFPSNWELSAGRAGAVVRVLTDNGLPVRRLRAIGYADSRPLVQNTDPESRARNRRVTLVIED